MGFFYVSSPEVQDLLNLPEFSLPPLTKHNWSEKPCEGDTDLDHQMAWILELMTEVLCPTVLLATWICRRVLPLQRRCHRIWDMSRRLDPTRISTFKVAETELVRRLNLLADVKD